ncbi:MAG TPA: DUF167 domain-containing protein [Dehalococcoidia bacterium]|nr:DUF167 domain-containing protein [Dehalococcoidia bacterium]
MAYIAVRVTPSARRNSIDGWYGHALRVRVTAPPEQGRANEAVIRLLAEVLEVKLSRLRIVRGLTSRDKLIEVEGLADEELRQLLSV